MGVQIGRFGAWSSSDVTVTEFTQDGDRIQVGGWVWGSTMDVLRAERDRLLGHVDNDDEPVVPFVWEDDPSQDSWVQVESATVEFDLATTTTTANDFGVRWSAELYRVGTALEVVHEELLRFVLRPNAHSINDGDTRLIFAYPSSGVGFEAEGYLIPPSFSATVAGGDTLVRWDDDVTGTPFNFRARYRLEPSDAYVGACSILTRAGEIDDLQEYQNYPGTTVSGRRWPADYTDGGNATLYNGLVMVTPSTDTTAGNWLFGWWDPTENLWMDKVFAFGASDADFDVYPSGLQILHNSPERVTARFWLDVASSSVSLDMTLRRGSRLVYVTARDWLGSKTWQVRSAAAETYTSVTGGRRASAADVGGNRALILAPVANADPTTGDGLTISAAAASVTFGIGLEVDGTSAAEPWEYEQLTAEFYAYGGTRTSVGRE